MRCVVRRFPQRALGSLKKSVPRDVPTIISANGVSSSMISRRVSSLVARQSKSKTPWIPLLSTRGRRGGRGVSRKFSTIGGVEVMELGMPALSPTMEQGNIASWNKKVGDEITAGDVLAEVETDKATVAFESTEDGYLAAILVQEGAQDVAVGTLVAVMVEEEADIAAVQKAIESGEIGGEGGEAAPTAPTPAAPAPASSVTAPTATSSSGDDSYKRHFTPAVAILLGNNQLDPASIHGTGRKGMLLKGDVLQALEAGTAKKATASAAVPTASTPAPAASAPASPGSRRVRSSVDLPSSNMRKVIGKRLSESKSTIPHAYATIDCKMTNLLAMRKSMKDANPDSKPPSVNDFVIKAASLALRDVPEVNAVWDAANQEPALQPDVDISIAVAIDAGLITPIVFKADTMRLADISSKVKELAGKAKEGKLQPDEFIGGSFSISNLGMFGIAEFSAVINPPQACILAVGGSLPRVVPVYAKDGSVEKFESALYMSVRMSHDARCVEEDVAAQWLDAFKAYIEEPMRML